MKSPMATLILFFLILLSLCSSAPASSVTLLNAAKVLSNSGYLSMSLTLQLVSKTLEFESPTATIFAPLDPAFFRLGQPSLPLLQYHVSPKRFSVKTLNYLHRGTRIPTLLPNHTLTVTASPENQGQLSINNVRIDENAVLDDGSVIVYGIDDFFNSSFSLAPEPAIGLSSGLGPDPPSPGPSSAGDDTASNSLMEGESRWPGPESFEVVADLLRSKGYSIMAAFLDAQLVGFNRKTRLTVFAPVDEAIEDYLRNTTDYSLIFRQHVVSRLLPYQDLLALDDGTMLPTFSEGFVINVIKLGNVPVLNDVRVVLQDMYRNRWMVVHGLRRLLTSQPPKQDPIDADQDTFSDGYVSSYLGQNGHQDYGDYH